jgi:hypothetical protein
MMLIRGVVDDTRSEGSKGTIGQTKSARERIMRGFVVFSFSQIREWHQDGLLREL